MGTFNTNTFDTQLFNPSATAAGAKVVLNTILYPAFRIAGILVGPGFKPGPEQIADALEMLNTMLDSWRTERLLVFHVGRHVQNVNASQQSYLIGDGAPDWDVTRPLRIEFAGLIQTDNTGNYPTELPLSILTPLDWGSIAVKNITSSTPQKLYYEPTYDLTAGNPPTAGNPWGTVWLWPVPQVANQIALYLWEPLQNYDTENDPVTVPPGYLEALQYNLATKLAMRPWLGQKPGITPMALSEAKTLKNWVKTNNRPLMDLQMRCEGAALGSETKSRWDITTNQWRWQ